MEDMTTHNVRELIHSLEGEIREFSPVDVKYRDYMEARELLVKLENRQSVSFKTVYPYKNPAIRDHFIAKEAMKGWDDLV